MQNFLHKSLALLLSASLLCAYAVPGYSAEAPTQTEYSNETFSGATEGYFDNDANLVIKNSTFSDNSSTIDDGAAINSNGTLNVEGTKFNNNTVNYDGGAGGALFLKGTNTIDKTDFEGNSVVGDYGGGALYLSNKSNSLTLTNSTFTNNTATNATSAEDAAGGAVALLKKADLEKVTFTGNKSVSTGNLGNGGGGAMFIGAEGKVKIEESSFTENNSNTDGGAIATRTEPPASNIDATLDIDETTFTGNIASGKGGAIYNSFYNSTETPGYASIEESTFTGNSAAIGGAIYNDQNGKISIEEGAFSNNTAATAGGAIYNLGTLTVTDNTTFTGNKVTPDYYDGGAIYTKGDLNISQGVSFLNNEADFGGAIYVSGHNTTNIDGATFTGNKVESDTYPVAGGAIYHALTSGSTETKNTLNIKNSSFSNNSAISSVGAAGGALAIFAKADLDTVTFEQNQTNGEDGGGAIFLGSVSETAIKDATFSNNTATVGGAISSRTEPPNDNSKATLDITGSTFTGNIATDKGGAIYNSFYNSNNAAGAAYIADSTFSNNEAATEGGAIYNALNGHLTLAGTNIFRGNTAGGVANDIYNLGTLNIGGTASFEGGIAGTGIVNVTDGATVNLGLGTIEADSISFANGSTLGVTLGNDAMGNLKANSITIGETTDDTANLIVTVSTDFAAADSVTQQLTNTAIADGTGTFAMADVSNALYDVSFNAATNEVTAVRKSQEEQTTAIENAGGNANNLATITAFTSSSDLGSEAANQMAQTINQLAQTDVQAAVQATTALAPEQAAAKQAVQTSAVNQLFSAINSRLNNAANGSVRTYAFGNNSYYADGTNYSVWAQGLLNKSHKEGTADASAFTGRSTGLAFGVDTQIAEDWTAGLGYAYLHTNVSSLDRHDRVLGDNFFLYGQYRPSNFFVQAALNYGDSKYEEDKNVAGSEVNADYHIKAYSANVTAGYDLNENVTPLVGLRYTNTQQESYKDSSDQRVSSEKDDYLTAVLGVQLQQESMLDNIKIRPALNLGLAYDLLSDNVSSRVSLPNGTAYDVSGERLHRLSFEAGLSVAALVSDNVEVSLSYDGSFRQDYNSNTGSLKLRYMF